MGYTLEICWGHKKRFTKRACFIDQRCIWIFTTPDSAVVELTLIWNVDSSLKIKLSWKVFHSLIQNFVQISWWATLSVSIICYTLVSLYGLKYKHFCSMCQIVVCWGRLMRDATHWFLRTTDKVLLDLFHRSIRRFGQPGDLSYCTEQPASKYFWCEDYIVDLFAFLPCCVQKLCWTVVHS